MSTAKRISILIIMVGLLLPVASLGFVKGYNPNLGFVGSLAQMRVVFVEEETEDATTFLERRRGEQYVRVTVEEQGISYGYVFAFGCILVCLGTVGVLFNQQSNIPKEQTKNAGQNSPPETPVDLPEE